MELVVGEEKKQTKRDMDVSFDCPRLLGIAAAVILLVQLRVYLPRLPRLPRLLSSVSQ